MKAVVRWAAAAVVAYAGGVALAYVLVDRALRTDHEPDFGGDD